MKRLSRIAKYIFPLLLLSTCFSIGFGSWSLCSEKSYANTEIGKQTKDPVAYIKNGNGKTYYMTLEKAIAVANSAGAATDVWVIPDTKYTLKAEKLTTITINSNVTLQLPFQDEIVFDVFKGSGTIYDPNGSQSVSSTNALDDPSTYLRTQVTLSSNVKLENYGTINIGGVIGSEGGGKGPCGQTCSFYSEIVCSKVNDGNDNSAQITNYGLIKNQGSITTTSDEAIGIENASGSTMETVLVIGENRGGSALIKLGTFHSDKTITFDCSPFNTVYMPNISTKTKCDSGSTAMGLGNMYGGSSHNPVEVPIYGSGDNYLIQSTGGYAVSRYVRNGSEQFQDIDLFGDHSINYMKMPISISYTLGKEEISVSGTVVTKGVLFPLSYLNDLSFNSIDGKQANIACSQDIKVMPGGKLTIGENVALNIGQLAVYDSSFSDPLSNGVRYPDNIKEDGLFTLSGNASIESFGGFVTIGKENATLKISKSNQVKSKQIKGNPKNKKYDELVFDAKSSVSSNDGKTIRRYYLFANYDYKSSISETHALYWSYPSIRHSIKITINGVKTDESGLVLKKYTFTYPTFKVYVSDNESGSPKTWVASQSDATSTVYNNSTMEPKKLDIEIDDDKYLIIVPDENCDSITEGYSFNKPFVVEDEIGLTISQL